MVDRLLRTEANWVQRCDDVPSPHWCKVPEPSPPQLGDVRESILDQAKKIVTTNRNKSYGEPEQNFSRIAGLWGEYVRGKYQQFELEFSPGDVAIMMVLMKIARLEESPENWDSWLDGIGYLACGAQTVFDSPPKGE